MRSRIGAGAVALVVAASCGKGGKAGGPGAVGGSAGAQSFRDGVDLICRAFRESGAADHAPADRGAVVGHWLDARLTNGQARDLATRMGRAPDGAVEMLRTAARAEGLTRCASIADTHLPEDPWGEVAVPRLRGGLAVEPVPTGGVLAVVSPKAITVDGKELVQLHDGAPAGLELRGSRIARLEAWARGKAAAAAAAAADPPPVRIAIAPDVPAPTVFAAIGSLTPLGRRFALVVEQDGAVASVPLTVLDSQAAAAAGLGMVVALDRDRALVWSTSGEEGTLGEPALTAPRDPAGAWRARVQDALAGVVQRRFADGARPPASQRIIVMTGTDVTAGDEIEAIATVRQGPRGAMLFPDVLLSAPTGDAAAARDDRPADEGRRPEQGYAIAEMIAGDDDGATAGVHARSPAEALNAQLADVHPQGAIGGGHGPPGLSDLVEPPHANQPPPGRLKVVGVETSPDKALGTAMQGKIQLAYVAGLKRCYAGALRADPSLRGRITLTIDVTTGGTVVGARATAPSDRLARCVEARARSWRFARTSAAARATVVLIVVPE